MTAETPVPINLTVSADTALLLQVCAAHHREAVPAFVARLAAIEAERIGIGFLGRGSNRNARASEVAE